LVFYGRERQAGVAWEGGLERVEALEPGERRHIPADLRNKERRK
jgi:hypothetical protein